MPLEKSATCQKQKPILFSLTDRQFSKQLIFGFGKQRNKQKFAINFAGVIVAVIFA